MEARNTTMYKEQFDTKADSNFRSQKDEIKYWTVAGKSSIACNNKKIHNFGDELTVPMSML
jgi:hypothetical protein